MNSVGVYDVFCRTWYKLSWFIGTRAARLSMELALYLRLTL
jgi:hypothetical protein